MKFREHRGQLVDAMATCVELADRQALIDHIKGLYAPFFGPGYDFSQIEVRPYHMQPDERIGWATTYIVRLSSFGVVGFTDAPACAFPPMWTIYDHPADYPEHYVVRRWYGATLTTEFSLHQSLIEARKRCVENGGSVPLERSPGDEPQIVETWI